MKRLLEMYAYADKLEELGESDVAEKMRRDLKEVSNQLNKKVDSELTATLESSDFELFEERCEELGIGYQEWESDAGDYELRVDLGNLTKKQVDGLIDYTCNKKLDNYNYLIVWK